MRKVENEHEHARVHKMSYKLKTRHMLLLVALAETGNMHQAAKDTHMTQPGASKMLKDIEDLLNVPLFERLPRGVRPTEYGKSLISNVRMALAYLAQAQESIAMLQRGLSGYVNIGVIIAPALTLIPRAICLAKEEAPQLCIGVDVSTSDNLVHQLKQGKLDFLIARILELENEPSLLYEDISEEIVCVIGRKTHPLLQRQDLSLSDMAQAKWVLSPRGSILRNRFDMMFRSRDLETPTVVVETTAMSIVMSLLVQSDFLHVMPLEAARCYVQMSELAILPIEIPCRMERFGVIRSRNHVLSEGANLLLKHIRVAATELYA